MIDFRSARETRASAFDFHPCADRLARGDPRPQGSQGARAPRDAGAAHVVVVGRGHQARDDQLPLVQAREGRPVLRAHLRSRQGLGVPLRQVQAHPLPRRDLRPLRRRGHACPRCGASAWATSSSPCRWRTSGSSRRCPAPWATCSTSRCVTSRRSSTTRTTSSSSPGSRKCAPTSCSTRTSSWRCGRRRRRRGTAAFQADIGAPAVRDLLRRLDVDRLAETLRAALAHGVVAAPQEADCSSGSRSSTRSATPATWAAILATARSG